MRTVRRVQQWQLIYSASHAFNVFVQKHSEFAGERNGIGIILANSYESTQLSYSIFEDHEPGTQAVGWHDH